MIEHFGQKCRSRQGYPMVETRRRSPRQISFPQSRWQRLLADSSPCATIGANASQTAALFSWDRHAGEIHRLLSDATAHRA